MRAAGLSFSDIGEAPRWMTPEILNSGGLEASSVTCPEGTSRNRLWWDAFDRSDETLTSGVSASPHGDATYLLLGEFKVVSEELVVDTPQDGNPDHGTLLTVVGDSPGLVAPCCGAWNIEARLLSLDADKLSLGWLDPTFSSQVIFGEVHFDGSYVMGELVGAEGTGGTWDVELPVTVRLRLSAKGFLSLYLDDVLLDSVALTVDPLINAYEVVTVPANLNARLGWWGGWCGGASVHPPSPLDLLFTPGDHTIHAEWT